MKNLKLFLIIIFFFCIFKNSAFSSDKIAIIDFDTLLEKTNYGKQIISDLNSLNEQNLKSLKKIESEIKLSQENIKKQKNLLSEEELNKKINKLNSDIVEFQQKKSNLANNFNIKKKTELDEFFKKIIPEIEKYIDEQNISLVIDKKNIFIANKKKILQMKLLK